MVKYPHHILYNYKEVKIKMVKKQTLKKKLKVNMPEIKSLEDAFFTAIELGARGLKENPLKMSKKLDEDITALENNKYFKQLTTDIQSLKGLVFKHMIPQGIEPRLKVVIDNCDVVFGDVRTGKLYALECHHGIYSLRLLTIPK